MISKLKNSFNLIKNMGARYVAFRTAHELKVKAGIFKKQFPLNPEQTSFISLEEWKKQNNFFINGEIGFSEPLAKSLEIKFKDLLEGKVSFFNSHVFDLGLDYNWITNPANDYVYDNKCHWTQIPDYDHQKGDIKYVWEKSRFSYLTTVIRYDAYTRQDNSQFIWNEINSWMDANPINAGPNFKCSQEISLRVFNWVIALNFYKNSETLKEEFFQKVMHYIYWQLKHVYSNINFSRIAVRNNHAITETLALYLAGILFPFFPEASLWKEKGKRWLEEEIAYQIYEDGTFLQFSMNYHRVVVQLLSFAFAVTQKNDEKFSPIVYERAYKSLNFLVQCMEPSNGWLSNYGSNDGALFFNFSDLEYRDYRPQLNCLHKFLTGKPLLDFENNFQIQEEAKWFNANQLPGISFLSIKQNSGWHEFPTGGYYLLREKTGLTFIRCGNHKDRPAQADNLHLDIWYNGENILYDGGTYKYNTSPDLLNYFMGTASHNTVMLDEYNQMKKGSRFIWFNWTQQLFANTSNTEDNYIFEGEIKAFGFLNESIRHKRKIIKKKNVPEWIVEDEIINKPEKMELKQVFHPEELNSFSFISQDVAGLKVIPGILKGFSSPYYGFKIPVEYFSFKTFNNKIITKLIHK